MATSKELLEQHESDLLKIKKRHHFLKAFVEVLAIRTRGGLFDIHNDTVYQMAHDMNDMMAIDLASLCRGMIQRGGFFNKLQNHLAELRLARRNEIDPPKGTVNLNAQQVINALDTAVFPTDIFNTLSATTGSF